MTSVLVHHCNYSTCVLVHQNKHQHTGTVGTLENGYLRKVPLPRVPRSKSTSPVVVAATVLANPLDTGYLPDPRIPLYNNLI
jgi:hypothetical protein